MNAKFAILAAAIALTGNAFADGATYQYPQEITVGKSRAQVQAELAQARADGTLQVTEADWPKQPVFVAGKNRDEVRAEAIAAAKSGELQARVGEPHGFDGGASRIERVGTVTIAAAR